MIKSQYAPFAPPKSPGKLVHGHLRGLPANITYRF